MCDVSHYLYEVADAVIEASWGCVVVRPGLKWRL